MEPLFSPTWTCVWFCSSFNDDIDDNDDFDSSDNDDILHDEYGAQLFTRKKLLDIEFTLVALKENLSPHICGNAANLRS